MELEKSMLVQAQWVNEALQECECGFDQVPVRAEKTLSNVIEQYIRLILPHKKSSKSKRHSQEPMLRWWQEKLGHRNIKDIAAHEIAEIRETLLATPTKRGAERGTANVNRHTSILSHVFNIAIREWQFCSENPVKRLRKYKESAGRTRHLDQAEREALLAACAESTNPELYNFVLLAICTGARYGELQKLKWEDIDMFRRVMVLVDTKNGETRSIPLVSRAYELLAGIHQPKGPVFTSPMIRAWQVAIKKSGVEDFRIHDLRHTCASNLAMSGASTLEIAEVLGHKTLAMVKRYSHLSVESQRSALERMESQTWRVEG